MGIKGLPIHVYSTVSDLDRSSPSLWFSTHVQNFSQLSTKEIPGKCQSGYSYDSIVLNPSKYLAYLFSRATELGARSIQQHLPTHDGLASAVEIALEQVAGTKIAAIINCTGLGAKALCRDTAILPIRGQTLLVRINPTPDPSDCRITLQEDPAAAPAVTYCFPRPGTDLFVLGGTKKSGDWTAKPDSETTNGIIERCRHVWPALSKAQIEIVSQQVGLRPGRKGGARVETEELKVDGGKIIRVIHQYGHSGAGYQLSIGSAKKVLGLVDDIVGTV